MKKAYQQQVQRREEYDKVRGASGRTEEEQGSGGRQRDKRRRLEEEALLKVGLHWSALPPGVAHHACEIHSPFDYTIPVHSC